MLVFCFIGAGDFYFYVGGVSFGCYVTPGGSGYFYRVYGIGDDGLA